MEHPFAPQDQLCREELRARNLSLWQRLAAELLLDLTLRRGLAAARIHRLDDWADAMGTTRGNLHPVLRQLLLYDIIRQDERGSLWWINQDTASWKVSRRIELDAERAQRAASAIERLLSDNPLQPNQRELFEPEPTDAEAQAEAVRERAAVSPTPGQPPALADLCAPVRSEFQNAGYEFQNARSDFHNEKSAAAPPVSARARQSQAKTKPGSEPGKPGFSMSQGEARERPPLSADAFTLLEELEEWCAQGPEGPDLFESYRSTWEGRLRWKPALVERVLREGQVHVRERRQPPIRKSRGGFLDCLFRAFHDSAQATAAPSPRVPVPIVPKTAAPPEPAPEWEKSQELARRCADELRKHLGRTS